MQNENSEGCYDRVVKSETLTNDELVSVLKMRRSEKMKQVASATEDFFRSIQMENESSSTIFANLSDLGRLTSQVINISEKIKAARC